MKTDPLKIRCPECEYVITVPLILMQDTAVDYPWIDVMPDYGDMVAHRNEHVRQNFARQETDRD